MRLCSLCVSILPFCFSYINPKLLVFIFFNTMPCLFPNLSIPCRLSCKGPFKKSLCPHLHSLTLPCYSWSTVMKKHSMLSQNFENVLREIYLYVCSMFSRAPKCPIPYVKACLMPLPQVISAKECPPSFQQMTTLAMWWWTNLHLATLQSISLKVG